MIKGKILVTGCTGLVGHGICLTLINCGYEVWGTSRNSIKSKHPAFHYCHLDLDDDLSLQSIVAVLSEVDVIIHNAARIPSNQEQNSWDDYMKTNLESTRKLLKISSESGLKQFIFISGSPSALLDETFASLEENTPYQAHNDYASSKAMAEILCTQFDFAREIDVCVFRFPAPYGYFGTSEAVLPSFLKKAKAGEPISLFGNGTRQQIFTFVEDIGRACISAIETKSRGIYHISGPEVVTMKQLAETILRVFPETCSHIIYVGDDPQENRKINISIEKVKSEMGFVPSFSLLDGLTRIVNFDDQTNIFNREE